MPKTGRQRGKKDGEEPLLPQRPAGGSHIDATRPASPAGIGVSRPTSPRRGTGEMEGFVDGGTSDHPLEGLEPQPEPELVSQTNLPTASPDERWLSPRGTWGRERLGTAGTTMLTEDHDDDDGLEFSQQTDGWNAWVFFPQLLLRLFPPLMLLQLFPDFRPRVDVVTLCLGSAFTVMGTSQDVPLGVATLLAIMGVCQLLQELTDWPDYGNRESVSKASKAWIAVPLIASVTIVVVDTYWWDGTLASTGQGWKSPQELLSVSAFPSAIFFMVGVICVAAVVFVRLRWLYAWSVVTGQFCARADGAEEKWTWSRPKTHFFAESFCLGDFKVCGNQLKPARQRLLQNTRTSSVRHPSQDWKTEIFIDTAELFTSEWRGRQKRHRLRETCAGLANRKGVLKPTKIMKRHRTEDGVWSTPEWVDPATLGLDEPNALDVSVRYVEKSGAPAQLVLSLASAPNQVSIFDAAFAAGYRVQTTQHTDSDTDGSSVAACGDYMLPIKGKRLRFGKVGKNCDDMFLDYHEESGYSRAEQPGPWTISTGKPGEQPSFCGPSVIAPRASARGNSESHATRLLVKTPQPSRTGWSRPGQQSDQDVQVDAFYIVKYEVVFPSRVNFNMKEILGASIQSSKTNVEFWMLQVEAFFFLFLQLLAQMILLHLYFENRDRILRVKQYNVGLFSSLMRWVPDAWMETVLTEDGMYLPDSEILLPAVMYMFVAMISASEHACFNGLDSVVDSRENRWYRRGLHYWKVRTEDEEDSGQPGSEVLGMSPLMQAQQLQKTCTCVDILRCNCKCEVLPAVYYCVLVCALRIAEMFQLLPNDGPSKVQRDPYTLELESNIKWFSRQVSLADKKVSTSMRYDQRDDQRRHELLHTYVESPMYDDDLELDGYHNFIADVRIEVEAEFRDVGSAMVVFDMDADPSKAMDPISPYDQDFRRENTRTYMKASSIADMIMHLSRSRRLVHAKGEWLVNIAAVFHGTMPIWHALLPCRLGGGCLCNADLADDFDHFANEHWFIACSENTWQIMLHLSCAVLSAWLARGVLLRLLKCQKDYMWRYVNMLYFIQRTPWTSMRAQKTHWGLLPKFDLDTRGNIEAWNKIRLYLHRPTYIESLCLTLYLCLRYMYSFWSRYLQAYRIKTSRYRQVSVLLCFVAVVAMATFKGLMVIASRSGLLLDVPSAACERYKKNVCLQHTVEFGDDCEWYTANNGSRGREFCQSRDFPSCRSFDNATSCAEHDYCKWANGWHTADTNGRCAAAIGVDNFDTLAMFTFFDTAVVGFWLAYALYFGVLENEIKAAGFPYLLRMKVSELESAALHFVTERAQWTSKKKVAEYWRPEDKGLNTIAKKSKDLGTDSTKNARMEYDQQGDPRLNLKLDEMKDNFNEIDRKGRILYHQSRSTTSNAAALLSLSEHDVYICGSTVLDNGETLDDLRKLFKEYSLIAKTSSSRLDPSSRRIAIQNSDVFLLFLSKRTTRGLQSGGSSTATEATCTMASIEVQTELREAFLHQKRIMLMRDIKERFSDEDLQAERGVQLHVDPETNQKFLTEHQVAWLLKLEPVVRQRKNYITCLDRPYVQKEVRWAKQYRKPIITVFEKDPTRNGFFDMQKATKKYEYCSCGESGTDHKPGCHREFKFLLELDAVPYQREYFQVGAMLKNINTKVDTFKKLQAGQYAMDVEAVADARNKPGSWDFFLSHHQKTGGDQVQNLYHHFAKGEHDGVPTKTAWYDMVMIDKSEPAMEEGVRQSSCFILFLSADAAEKQADAMMKTISNGIKGREIRPNGDPDQDVGPDNDETSPNKPDVLVYEPPSDQQHDSVSLHRSLSNLRVSRPVSGAASEFLNDSTLDDDQLRPVRAEAVDDFDFRRSGNKGTYLSAVGERDRDDSGRTPRPGVHGTVDPETARRMREDLISLLCGLAETLDREHTTTQGGLHWGVEDRSTKMWFITLTRRRLYLIIAVTAAQIVMASVKAYTALSDPV